MKPPYNTPMYFRPSAARASTVRCSTWSWQISGFNGDKLVTNCDKPWTAGGVAASLPPPPWLEASSHLWDMGRGHRRPCHQCLAPDRCHRLACGPENTRSSKLQTDGHQLMCIQSYKQIKAMNLSTYKKTHAVKQARTGKLVAYSNHWFLPQESRPKTAQPCWLFGVSSHLMPCFMVYQRVDRSAVGPWEACAATIIAAVWPSEKAMQLHLGQTRT